jgi:plastocyanin
MVARRFRYGVAALALGAVALAACGGSSGGSSYQQPKGPAVKTLQVKSGNLYFDPTKLDAPPGIISIKLTNVESGSHDLRIRDVPGFDLAVNGDGDTAQKKVELKKGDYQYYCSIPGHEQMKGELIVG